MGQTLHFPASQLNGLEVNSCGGQDLGWAHAPMPEDPAGS